MKPSDRDKLGEQLSAYLDGELTADERAEVDALIERDPDARAMLADLEASIAAVQSLPRGQAPRSILDDLTARIERNEVLGPAEDHDTLGRHRRRPMRSLLAMAAVVVFAVGGGLWVSIQLSRPEKVVRTAAVDRELSRGERLPSAAEHELMARDRAFRAEEPVPDASAMTSERAENAGDDFEEISLVAPEAKTAPRPEDKSKGSLSDEGNVSSRLLADASQAGAEDSDALTKTSTPSSGGLGGAAVAYTTQENAKTPTEATQSEMPVEDTTLQLAEAPPPATFEQKLAAGQDITALRSHPFSQEPVQLTLAFNDAYSQQVASGELEHFLATRNLASVDEEVWSAAEGQEQTTRPAAEPILRRAAAHPSMQQALQYRGRAMMNYLPANPTEERILVRLPAATVDDLVDAISVARNRTQSIRMNVGALQAEGETEVRRLAQLAAGDAIVPEEAVGGRPAGQLSDRDYSDMLDRDAPDFDLVDLMKDLGLALPEAGKKAEANESAEEDTKENVASMRRRGRARGLAQEQSEAEPKSPASEQPELVTMVIELVTEHPAPQATSQPATQPATQPAVGPE